MRHICDYIAFGLFGARFTNTRKETMRVKMSHSSRLPAPYRIQDSTLDGLGYADGTYVATSAHIAFLRRRGYVITPIGAAPGGAPVTGSRRSLWDKYVMPIETRRTR